MGGGYVTDLTTAFGNPLSLLVLLPIVVGAALMLVAWAAPPSQRKDLARNVRLLSIVVAVAPHTPLHGLVMHSDIGDDLVIPSEVVVVLGSTMCARGCSHPAPADLTLAARTLAPSAGEHRGRPGEAGRAAVQRVPTVRHRRVHLLRAYRRRQNRTS